MSQKAFYSTSGVLFLIIATMHLLRVLNGWEANIETFIIPMWFSWVSILLVGYLAYQGLTRRG